MYEDIQRRQKIKWEGSMEKEGEMWKSRCLAELQAPVLPSFSPIWAFPSAGRIVNEAVILTQV